MQNIEMYIRDRYDNDIYWFEKEVEQAEHLTRITNVINNRNYLAGKHKILNREDSKWKEQEFITKKLILNQAKTIMNFHSTYLLGKPLCLIGSEKKVAEYQKVYRLGDYNNIDYKVLDNVNKYADCFEYVYMDNKVIKSKLILPEDGYPIYSEDTGEYIAFIEHYTCNSNCVSYYNVYYPTKVECWDNQGGELLLKESKINVSGLPIHHTNDDSRSLLEDLKPIFDEFEDIMSKMSDSIYTLSLNPIPVSIGQRIEGNIPADACGFMINLDAGDMKYVNANIDSNTIKLYFEKLQQQLNIIAHMPSIALGNSNVANVSEVSLKLLYQLADVQAMLNEKWFRVGLNKRFAIFDKLLSMKGITFSEDEYIDVEFTYARPVNTSEVLDNLKKQYEMMAISTQTIIEKSPYTIVGQELERLKESKSMGNNMGNNIE